MPNGRTKEGCSVNEVHEGMKGRLLPPLHSQRETPSFWWAASSSANAKEDASKLLRDKKKILTRVKLLGDAAHLLTVVRGHSWTTSLVRSSTRITDSLVMPRRRGTSLFLLFIFSCGKKFNKGGNKIRAEDFVSLHKAVYDATRRKINAFFRTVLFFFFLGSSNVA